MATRHCRLVGEEILIAGPGHSSSSPNLRGELLEIWETSDGGLFRVRWGDGTETVLPETLVRVPARRRVRERSLR